MSEWRVELIGDAIDLQCAYEAFADFDPCILREEGQFFLKANEFEVAQDAEAVRNRAKEITRVISNAVYLHYRDTRPIMTGHIIHIDDNGQRRSFVFAEGNIQLRGVVSGILVNGASAPPRQHRAISIFRAASSRADIADALAYFSHGDWINLYKAYEIVRDNIGSESLLIQSGWVTRSVVKRFTQTAQSRDAIGDNARHASKKYKAPISPMSVHEARALIGDLLQKWVDAIFAP
jgi:hypothetical protein